MQRVRLDGDGIGAPDDMALEGDEKDRRSDGDAHDHQTKTAVLDHRGIDQAISRLDQQEHGRPRDEGALPHGRQRLRLAMAEAMIGIGRDQGGAHGKQIDHRCGGIEQ